MDERVKHRIIGFIVIFALIAIVAPILVKTTKPVWKSIQTTTTFHIPNAKLRHPKMVVKDPPNEWTKSNRVAHISLDKSITSAILKETHKKVLETKVEVLRPSVLPSIKPAPKLSLVSELERIPDFPKIEKIQHTKTLPLKLKKAVSPTVKKKVKHATIRPTSVSKKKHYHVVLGAFNRSRNVGILLTRLKKMGYGAHTHKITTKNGKHYTQVILNQTYLRQDTGKIIKLFNDKLHILGVVRRT